MKLSASILRASVVSLSLAMAACHHQAPPPAAPAPAPVVVAPTPAPVVEAPVPAVAPVAAHAELHDNRVEISQDVEFQENSEALHEHSTEILTRVAELVHAHPEIHGLRIEGHTDNLGTPEHNHHLSEGRAEAVEHFLHAHGVTVALEHVGFGATRPLCTEDTAPCRARNRRVDFIVTDGPAAAAPAAAAPAAPAAAPHAAPHAGHHAPAAPATH